MHSQFLQKYFFLSLIFLFLRVFGHLQPWFGNHGLQTHEFTTAAWRVTARWVVLVALHADFLRVWASTLSHPRLHEFLSLLASSSAPFSHKQLAICSPSCQTCRRVVASKQIALSLRTQIAHARHQSQRLRWQHIF